MMATGASTAIASDSAALRGGEALREPELPFQGVVTCKCSRRPAEVIVCRQTDPLPTRAINLKKMSGELSEVGGAGDYWAVSAIS